MSLVNEKEFNINDYKPKLVDEIVGAAQISFSNKPRSFRHSCPACTAQKYSFAFDKFGFHYVRCDECMSLYVQDTLNAGDKQEYDDCLEDSLYTTQTYCDYIDTLSKKNSIELELTFSRLLGKNSLVSVGYIGTKKNVFQEALNAFDVKIEDIKLGNDAKYDVIILDNEIEKVLNLQEYLGLVDKILNEEGFIFTTMRVGSGMDILTLWEESKLFPIEHNNLLSIDGLKIAFSRNFFIIKEINTPGVMDIDNILATNSGHIPRFLTHLSKTRNVKALDEFQSFIQKNLLSSYCTVVVTKRKAQ